ncbi:MAG: hypothetical protein M3T49_05955 [Candidatus Eremiobacteraeota bacterium]|nr:hypothetical protein [Candidatus Eremiobacteraeota bacterium]
MALATSARSFHAPSPPVSSARRVVGVKKRRPLSIGVATLGFIGIVSLLLAYVAMTTQLTAQTYRLVSERETRSALLETNNDLRQKVARLESLPRLQAVAVSLHMAEPTRVTAIVPAPAVRRSARSPDIAAGFTGAQNWLRAW